MQNVYLSDVQSILPRILASFDYDQTSQTMGFGDRLHWAWGIKDFPNATFQGAVHGISRLWKLGLWPYDSDSHLFLQRIDSIILATSKMTYKDGSLDEAFPNEGSYCVTALVAYDLLCTFELLCNDVPATTLQSWKEVIRPLIAYLISNDETHAIISNHLATATAALLRWYNLTADDTALLKAECLKDRILNHQSLDGWFEEYGGADPGYLSLCLYYLADVHYLRPEWNLIEPLKRCVEFLTYFAHPDGSFGGNYGARSTRFYCPTGILRLAREIPEAMSLAAFMDDSIAKQRVVTLPAFDESNMVPMFNCYAWAIQLAEPIQKLKNFSLPAISKDHFTRLFEQSGLLVDKGKSHYSIIALKSGGVVYHFVDNELEILNTGVVITNRKGSIGSSRAASTYTFCAHDPQKVDIKSNIVEMTKSIQNPLKLIILRLLCVSIFKFSVPREITKKIMVKLLITNTKQWRSTNVRSIRLGETLTFHDTTNLANGHKVIDGISNFVPFHMASKGYWQKQDELYNDT